MAGQTNAEPTRSQSRILLGSSKKTHSGRYWAEVAECKLGFHVTFGRIGPHFSFLFFFFFQKIGLVSFEIKT